ncbi:hypothetical protein GOGNHFCO_00077 [bovine alphaherpesvirus 1]|nr:hypothetical protein GOGNHFCO_00060 [Bovine alphaherpesvirus 1]AVM39300.1 hypothetical protein GOGNHFCO_00077 [Bovine alphaherpesvirus 1]
MRPVNRSTLADIYFRRLDFKVSAIDHLLTETVCRYPSLWSLHPPPRINPAAPE